MPSAVERLMVEFAAIRQLIESLQGELMEVRKQAQTFYTHLKQLLEAELPGNPGLDDPIKASEFQLISHAGGKHRVFRQGPELRPVMCPLAWKFATHFDFAQRGNLDEDEAFQIIKEEVKWFISLLKSKTPLTNSMKEVELTWSGGTAATLNKILGMLGIGSDVYAIDQLACAKPSSTQGSSQQDNRKAIKIDIGLVLKNRREGEEPEELPIVIEFKPVRKFPEGLDQLARYCSSFAAVGVPPTFLAILLDHESGNMEVKLMMPMRFPADSESSTTERSAASSSSNRSGPEPSITATSAAPSTTDGRKRRSTAAPATTRSSDVSSAASSSSDRPEPVGPVASTATISAAPPTFGRKKIPRGSASSAAAPSIIRFVPMDLITVSNVGKKKLLAWLISAICRTVDEMKREGRLCQSRQQQQLSYDTNIRLLRGSRPTVARHDNLVVKVYHPLNKTNYRSIDLNVKFMNATVELDTALVKVLTYPWIEGEVCPKKLTVRQFIDAAAELASLYHHGLKAHGDLRFSNLVFTDTGAKWIDFDYSVALERERERYYPPSWNRKLRDTKRHPKAKGGRLILREHDLFSFARMLALYTPSQEFEHLWSSVCQSARHCHSIEDIAAALENFQKEFQEAGQPLLLERNYLPYHTGTGSPKCW